MNISIFFDFTLTLGQNTFLKPVSYLWIQAQILFSVLLVNALIGLANFRPVIKSVVFKVKALLHHAWPYQAGEGCRRPGPDGILAPQVKQLLIACTDLIHSQHGHEEGGSEQAI